MTKYLGEWLKQNYDLPDHRSDEKYHSWDTDYAEYESMIASLAERIIDESAEEGDE